MTHRDDTHARTAPSRLLRRRARSGPLLVALGATFAVGASGVQVSCASAPSCDSACGNIVQKCSDQQTATDVNTCMETCAANVAAVPAACASERDDLLTCLASASSIECSDPTSSVACMGEKAAVDACAKAVGSGGTGAGAGTGASSSSSSSSSSSGSGSGAGAGSGT